MIKKISILSILMLSACVQPDAQTNTKQFNGHNKAKVSWYNTGSKTANGEHFRPMGLTVAHKHLAFGTMVRFHNKNTGATAVARVNDRGPFIKGREFDLSEGMANKMGIKGAGTSVLEYEIVKGE